MNATDVGHHAFRPTDIPMRGWMQIFVRVWRQAGGDHISLISAGVAFYGLLALFPAIAAMMAIGGLILDPAAISGEIERFSGVMPPAAAEIILDQVVEVAGSQNSGLGIAAVVSIALALYSASKGVSSLIEGLNIAYDESEQRSFAYRLFITLVLTVFLIIGTIAGLSAILVLPGILSFLDLGRTTELLIGAGRWMLLLLMTIVGIAILYRFGPDRSSPNWRWLIPGAIAACMMWIAISMGFAFYAENFGNYNKTFGTMAGVIVLLLWLWLSAYVLLLGAELNAEAELQTRYDTTIGDDMPIGQRGAVKADTPPPTVDEPG